jgi:hypothetical protein
MFRGSAWCSPGLSVLQAESVKIVPVCPDRLRIEVENHPDHVAGRDWIEVTRLAEEMAASGYRIPGLSTFVHNSLSFRRGTQLVDVGCHSWKMEEETNMFNFRATLRMPNEN